MTPTGFHLHPQRLGEAAQRVLLGEVLEAVQRAPFYRPMTRFGPMSVEMTNLGAVGWVADGGGYRYADRHPVTGEPWPAIPSSLIELWAQLADRRASPDACLVNLYRDGARLGLHQDRDEADFSFPVLSVSLGDTAIFRVGGSRRGASAAQVRLSSGDVCILQGEARMAFHGVDRILPGSSRLVPGGGRINLTLRRARAV